MQGYTLRQAKRELYCRLSFRASPQPNNDGHGNDCERSSDRGQQRASRSGTGRHVDSIRLELFLRGRRNTPMELRNIGSGRKFNSDGRIRMVRIMLRQSLSDLCCSHPNHGVIRRVVVHGAPEHFHADHALAQSIKITRQRTFHGEAKKVLTAFAAREGVARNQRFEGATDQRNLFSAEFVRPFELVPRRCHLVIQYSLTALNGTHAPMITRRLAYPFAAEHVKNDVLLLCRQQEPGWNIKKPGLNCFEHSQSSPFALWCDQELIPNHNTEAEVMATATQSTRKRWTRKSTVPRRGVLKML